MTLRATRTMKARRPGRCPLCQTGISVGQQIAQLRRTWVHATCAADRIRRHRVIVERENT